MRPVHFCESNGTLTGGPASKFGTSGDVGDLPVFRDGKQIISCWMPSLSERLSVLFFGRAWLYISTPHTHPPVVVVAQRKVFDAAPATPKGESE